jgi:hypothetical protein
MKAQGTGGGVTVYWVRILAAVSTVALVGTLVKQHRYLRPTTDEYGTKQAQQQQQQQQPPGGAPYAIKMFEAPNAKGGEEMSGGLPAHQTTKANFSPRGLIPSSKVWVTGELEQYASLAHEDIGVVWEQLEAMQAQYRQAEKRDPQKGVTLSPAKDLFGRSQSEFALALTMLSTNVSNVCEVRR